jgi:hypothetical protein
MEISTRKKNSTLKPQKNVDTRPQPTQPEELPKQHKIYRPKRAKQKPDEECQFRHRDI